MKTAWRKDSILCLAVIGIVVFMGFQGCGTVQVKEGAISDPVVRNALLQETGFTLAFYGLSRESEPAVLRVRDAIVAAQQLMQTKDVREVTNLTIQYIRDFPQWKVGAENYDVLIGRAVNVLTLLVEVDLSVPEKYQAAFSGLHAFLGGALQGADEIIKSRVKTQGA